MQYNEILIHKVIGSKNEKDEEFREAPLLTVGFAHDQCNWGKGKSQRCLWTTSLAPCWPRIKRDSQHKLEQPWGCFNCHQLEQCPRNQFMGWGLVEHITLWPHLLPPYSHHLFLHSNTALMASLDVPPAPGNRRGWHKAGPGFPHTQGTFKSHLRSSCATPMAESDHDRGKGSGEESLCGLYDFFLSFHSSVPTHVCI